MLNHYEISSLHRKLAAVPLTIALLAGSAIAQPTVNGTIAGDDYGAAVSVQAVETQFGDNDGAGGTGSELDAAYCTSDGARLYLALTGNLEANFNKLEIFIDSKDGGENVLSGTPGNDGSGVMAGLTFDAGFAPDYHIIVRRGNFNGDRFDLDFAELGTADFSFYGDLFGGTSEGSASTGTGINAEAIEVGFDNSNIAGVLGGTAAADEAAALAVETGLELSIALSDLDHTSGNIKICAFVNNGDHNYASNQFLGPLAPPQGNLGGDGAGNFTGVFDVDFGSFAGDQFFTCVTGTVSIEDRTWGQIKSLYR